MSTDIKADEIAKVADVVSKTEKKAGFLLQLLSDTGNVSMMRFLVFGIVGLIMLKFVMFNVSAYLGHTPPFAFDQTDCWVLGIALFGKMGQAGFELMSPPKE